MIVRILPKLIIGSLIFVGLPLIGWGLNDMTGFAANPARAGYIVLVVLLQVFILIKLPEAGSRRFQNTKVVARQRLILTLLQWIPLVMIVAAPYDDHRGVVVWENTQILRYAGLCLFSLGFIGMHWAEASLGEHFTVEIAVRENHKLITHGLYARLRHPRYLSVLTCFGGFVLIFRSGLALFLFMGLILVHLARIHDEEIIMRQEFGAAWEAYAKKTWRLIPLVY